MSVLVPSVKIFIMVSILLDDIVDLHPSTAKFLGDRVVALPRLTGFDHLQFHEDRQYHACLLSGGFW